MNARPLPTDRRAASVLMLPPPLWTPPDPTDPGYGRWYEEQECLAATYREIPSDRYDYFEEVGHD